MTLLSRIRTALATSGPTTTATSDSSTPTPTCVHACSCTGEDRIVSVEREQHFGLEQGTLYQMSERSR